MTWMVLLNDCSTPPKWMNKTGLNKTHVYTILWLLFTARPQWVSCSTTMGEQLLPFLCCFSNAQGIRGASDAKWTTGVLDMPDIQNGQGMSPKLGPWSRGFKLYSIPSLKDAIGHVVLLWDGTRWWFQSSCVCLPLLSEKLQVDLRICCLDAWGKSPTRGVLRNHIDPTYKQLQGGPQPAINGLINPVSRVITSVTHL